MVIVLATHQSSAGIAKIHFSVPVNKIERKLTLTGNKMFPYCPLYNEVCLNYICSSFSIFMHFSKSGGRGCYGPGSKRPGLQHVTSDHEEMTDHGLTLGRRTDESERAAFLFESLGSCGT